MYKAKHEKKNYCCNTISDKIQYVLRNRDEREKILNNCCVGLIVYTLFRMVVS